MMAQNARIQVHLKLSLVLETQHQMSDVSVLAILLLVLSCIPGWYGWLDAWYYSSYYDTFLVRLDANSCRPKSRTRMTCECSIQ